MNIPELKKQISEEMKIDRDNLMLSLLQNPILLSKYLGYIHSAKLKLAALALQYKKLYGKKHLYYSGHVKGENGEFYPFALDKTTIKIQLEGDTEICQLENKINEMEHLISYLDSVAKGFISRGYQIKTIQDIREFEAGK